MKIEIREINDIKLAIITSDEIIIKNLQDALDLMAECFYYHNLHKIILQKENITPDFFDLKTKLAGDILQKFSTYSIQLAIIGDFSEYSSQSLIDFIFESNKQGRINFVNSIEQAIERLIKY